MAYSKLRGARKPKKKEENALNIAEHDAFQEQGMKIVDKVLEHPYFIFGSVAAVILAVVVAMLISSSLKSRQDKLAYEYAYAVELLENEESMDKPIEAFKKIIDGQEGSFNAAASMVYLGKIYQSMNDCDKAIEYFNQAKKSGKLKETLLFGIYEGEAFCHFDKQDFEKAADIWKEWLNKKTDLYKDYALYYIGVSYEKSGKQDEALPFFKRIKDEYPNSILVSKIIDKVPSENESDPVTAEN